jgi:hypothetical protein
MDSVIKSEFHYQDHTDVITHKTSQPTENLILARNAELRKNPGSIADLGAQSGGTFGRLMASIPIIMYEKAKRDGYDLDNRDSYISGREMARYLKSAEGRTCLVQANG